MLETSNLVLFTRSILELIIFNWIIYTLSDTKFDYKRYSLSIFIMFLIDMGVKYLSIQFGIHTLIFISEFILISVYIHKIELIKSIQITFIIFITTFVCELLNELLVVGVFQMEVSDITNPLLKILAECPSLIFLIGLVYCFKVVIRKVKKIA